MSQDYGIHVKAAQHPDKHEDKSGDRCIFSVRERTWQSALHRLGEAAFAEPCTGMGLFLDPDRDGWPEPKTYPQDEASQATRSLITRFALLPLEDAPVFLAELPSLLRDIESLHPESLLYSRVT